MKYILSILSTIFLLIVAVPILSLGQVSIERNKIFINVGAGVQGNRFRTGTWQPSVNASGSYAVIKNVTLGLEGSYYGQNISKEVRFNSYAITFRGSYYFNSVFKRDNRKLNYYAGVGIMSYRHRITDFVATKGKIYVPFHIGAKSLFYRNIGANAEIGINDMGFIKVGLFTKL